MDSKSDNTDQSLKNGGLSSTNVARSCEDRECVPIHNNDVIKSAHDVISSDEDDAAVILEELALNFGLSARTSPGRGDSVAILSALSKSTSHGAANHSPRTLLRTCVTKVLVDESLKAGRNRGHIARLLSAKRNHIHELANDAVLLKQKIKELEEQNRVLTRITKRQESALNRYHDEETRLPHLLEAHKMEIRILQDKLRKATDINKKDSEKLKIYDGRMIKLTEELSNLRQLSIKKNLLDRDTLNRKLTTALNELQEKERGITELNRRILILNKSFQQQIKRETSKHRDTARKLDSVKADYQITMQKLKDRENQLAAVQNNCPSRSSKRLSSASLSALSKRSSSLEIPGAISTETFTLERIPRKRTARKLTPASFFVSSTSENLNRSITQVRKSKNDGVSFLNTKNTSGLDTHRTCILPDRRSCNLDREMETSPIDFDIQNIGWTTDYKLNRRKSSADVPHQTERGNSEKLLPLGTEFGIEQKNSATLSQPSSNIPSSPDDHGSLENQSVSNGYQTSSSVALQDSVSRKITTVSSWSDETQVEEFSLSRNTSSPSSEVNCHMMSENNIPFKTNDSSSSNLTQTGSNKRDRSCNQEEKLPKMNLDSEIRSNFCNSDDCASEIFCSLNLMNKHNDSDDESHLILKKNSNDSQDQNCATPTMHCTAEERLKLSLIENYPPKERRKLENKIEQVEQISKLGEIEESKNCDLHQTDQNP